MVLSANCLMQVPEVLNAQSYLTLRYHISYYHQNSVYPQTTTTLNSVDDEVTYTLGSLMRDTEYTILIRIEVRYSYCSSYTSGLSSNPVTVTFQTNATCGYLYIYFNFELFECFCFVL